MAEEYLPIQKKTIKKYNKISRAAQAEIIQQVEAEQRNDTVIICGTLYLPLQYPRTLLAEQIKILTTDSQMDPRYGR